MSMISLILPSLIVVKIKRHTQRDTDNLLSASDYTNFAFNFALTVTCKLKLIVDFTIGQKQHTPNLR